MINLSKGIDSLTSFKRDTSRFVAKLKKTGEAMVLTVNGKAEIVVQDTESYQKLLEQVQWAETIRVLQRSLEDIKAGRVSTLKEAKMALQKKLNVQTESRLK